MERLSITSMQELIIDEQTGTCFIEDDRYREVLHIYLPDLIKKLTEVTEKHNPNIEDFFWKIPTDTLKTKFEEHRLKHAKQDNFARAQAIQDLMEDCGLYEEKSL